MSAHICLRKITYMKISKRLQKIALMVKFPTLADIGTDHAHLPVYLVRSGKLHKALATDINPAPLARALDNIAAAGLSDYIKTRLCDGLDGVNPQEYETCVISGMGGGLIIDILRQNLGLAHDFKQIILSPQRDVADVRIFLHQNGFCVKDEDIIEEKDKFYNVLDIAAGSEVAYDEKGYIFGEKLLEKNSEVFKKFIAAEIKKTKNIIRGLTNQSTRKNELERYLQLCLEVTECP